MATQEDNIALDTQNTSTRDVIEIIRIDEHAITDKIQTDFWHTDNPQTTSSSIATTDSSEESSSQKSVNSNTLSVPVKNALFETTIVNTEKGLTKRLSLSSLFSKKKDKDKELKKKVAPESPSPVQSYITSTVTSITSEIDAEIVEWLEQFKKYTEVESRCKAGIAELNSIKINLERLIGRQKKDDALFYQSIIENSYFFLENSLRIRRSKFIRDLLAISSLIENYKHIKINPKPVNIDNSSFTAITNDIKDIYEEIERAKRNSSTLSWVKDDQISTLQEIEKDMSETLTYHILLIEYFEKLVIHELNFYK